MAMDDTPARESGGEGAAPSRPRGDLTLSGGFGTHEPGQGDAPGADETEAMDPKFLESLVCPMTHGPLSYNRAGHELVSKKARLAYPIRRGVPIMLRSEARELKDGE